MAVWAQAYRIRFMSNGAAYKVEEVGVFRLEREPRDNLSTGDVGYIFAGIKTVSDTKIGDTITLDSAPAPEPLSGFKDVKPVVFSSIYPIASDDYQSLTDSLAKYKLNDAALVYQKDSSAALGMGVAHIAAAGRAHVGNGRFTVVEP